jgi:hypothetical protein
MEECGNTIFIRHAVAKSITIVDTMFSKILGQKLRIVGVVAP